MKIPERDFIANDEILFVGYSSRKDSFSRMLYKEFGKAGIKVYPLNPNKENSYDIDVFHDISEIDKIPETAYILTGRDKTAQAFAGIQKSGVKRILFQNKKLVPQEVLDKCSEMGIEAAVACPMMLIGGGLHRIHRFFASLGK